mmetsp:Transcript_16849/g.39937  ORF Transcript_16849/g.39937 Transcript_16849/m.39937 type:complete len:298 (-) Transcript_16849:127-1020(-)
MLQCSSISLYPGCLLASLLLTTTGNILDLTHLLVLAIQPSLPKRDSAISAAHGQYAPGDAPAQSPHGLAEVVEEGGLPNLRPVLLPRPNNDGPVFGARRHDVHPGNDGRGPCHVADPVGMRHGLSQGGGVLLPLGPRGGLLGPESDPVVASGRRHAHRGAVAIGPCHIRSPAHGVDPQGVVGDVLHGPGIVLVVTEEAHPAVGAGGRAQEAVLVGGEGDAVDAGIVQAAGGVDEGPRARGRLAVDEDGAVEAARGQDDAELGVGPGQLPDGSLVALEGRRLRVGVAGYVVDLHGAVR